ncbi:uncharacterized protein G2W53_034942 [Senna tora]|uniref:Uncharacterized protein n=1 Tax=Senna tora TaxID=362788 RepID=A0A834T2R2_9FABA|nr:uncharacterized protein G2W53_034942 [Senna tora]
MRKIPTLSKPCHHKTKKAIVFIGEGKSARRLRSSHRVRLRRRRRSPPLRDFPNFEERTRVA